ncbi:hypothetical protein [Oceanobacillus damuensis]|uniref:hypothetical protein n=1 Tax=Oceanobacillus damuensis TaxID=937928 RepID=UPI000830652A|nr:hypothetical protein [Oceanobacillus damuensis]
MSNQRYYVNGNTAEGLLNFLPSNIADLNRIILLKHPSETVKTAVIRQAIQDCDSKYDLEILKSPLGFNYLDGVIIREISTAVFTDRIASKELKNTIDFDLNSLFGVSQETTDYHTKNMESFHTFVNHAHQNFAVGLKVHDELEAIYIKEMDFERADQLATNFIHDLLHNKDKQNRRAHVYHRFFGTNTPEGAVNEVPSLIESISNVYFIKGRAGTGKSTFMKKIAIACEQHGFDVEVYHCSFDPNSLDMVLVGELDFCIFDSTDPHEFFPKRVGETIIDLYEKTVTPGTDEKFAGQIDAINRRYKAYMKKGIQELQKAGIYFEENEQKFGYTEEEVARAYGELMVEMGD